VTRLRALESTRDLCCLPSPYRIPQSVAGMAFNFSKVEISHHSTQRNATRTAETSPRTNGSRSKTQTSRLGS
jgi:hypothetical protein